MYNNTDINKNQKCFLLCFLITTKKGAYFYYNLYLLCKTL